MGPFQLEWEDHVWVEEWRKIRCKIWGGRVGGLGPRFMSCTSKVGSDNPSCQKLTPSAFEGIALNKNWKLCSENTCFSSFARHLLFIRQRRHGASMGHRGPLLALGEGSGEPLVAGSMARRAEATTGGKREVCVYRHISGCTCTAASGGGGEQKKWVGAEISATIEPLEKGEICQHQIAKKR